MADPLTVAVAQPPVASLDVAGNAETQAAVVREAGARVVVFPELSLTGYELDAPVIGVDDVRLAPLVTACSETGTLALVGAPVSDAAQRRYIAMLAVDGGGVRVAYRKVWLGGEEPRHFTPGGGVAAIDVDGRRLGLAICKDTGIPEHAAETAALGIDGYVAGVAEHAADAAVLDERSRRIAADHGVWVAIASFAGPTGGGFTQTAGRSSIRAPDGRTVARAEIFPGQIARATLP